MKFFVCFAALCCIILILSDQYQSGTALRKKKIFKKLKDLLPLLLAFKGGVGKKLFVLPIPIPIKIKKQTKSWPSIPPAWQISQPQPQISWQPSPTVDLTESWPSMPAPQPSAYQSAPPTKLSPTYLPAEYLTDNALRQGIEQYLTSYIVRDGPGLSYALNNLNVGYRPAPYSSSGFRPISPVLASKSIAPIKKPFGQPVSSADIYESGRGTAPIYSNDKGLSNIVSSKSASINENANRVQFQTSVSSDYSNGGSAYVDNVDNVVPSNNEAYKSQNEINYEDNRIKSVSSDYSGAVDQDNTGSVNEAAFDENNELINDNNIKETASLTYNTNNSVPAPRPYKKKSKV